ncbi:hypothetical protein P3T36_001442 [Kitasatospora sp. MAP12-15]|uniref:hypothetical protein n=1 Tax=unclassified Kitasatospora TaxID=2633591 RepID=UPI0024762AA8|nr:hypothetical protein [Kitasatospora sp. MAP12-44]MDH6112560.1 hypothetical protein [Kitasatospora sp. MAP12-44]
MTTTMTTTRRRFATTGRSAATVVLAATLGLLAAPLAQAAPAATPPAVAQSDLAAARSAVQAPSVLDQLGHFFARGGVPPTQPLQLGAAAEAQAAAQAAPRLTGATVAVYTLDPGFVAQTQGAPVARADFAATEVVSADGRKASVWTVQQNGGWRVVNIASGSDETDYAAQGARSGGGTVFREPQVNAWYVLRGNRVLPLDAEARGSVGAGGVTLAAYQRLVHQRYGDKLPGSAYDKAGLGGGFSTGAAPAPAPAGVAAPADGGALPALTAAAALGITALAGVGLATRRRRGRTAVR